MSSSTASRAGRFEWMSEIRAYFIVPSGLVAYYSSKLAYTNSKGGELKGG
jgi:hypothetical protein